MKNFVAGPHWHSEHAGFYFTRLHIRQSADRKWGLSKQLNGWLGKLAVCNIQKLANQSFLRQFVTAQSFLLAEEAAVRIKRISTFDIRGNYKQRSNKKSSVFKIRNRLLIK